MMKFSVIKAIAIAACVLVAGEASAQFNLKRAVNSATKVAKAAVLTDSQLGSLGTALINAKYSQKQENEADDCGYDFMISFSGIFGRIQ